MNETMGRGYARIEAMRAARGDTVAPAAETAQPPPPQRIDTVYIALTVAGCAFLLPFNSFIMAVDYFQHHYPNSTIIFDMSTVYISTACVAVVINNLLLDLFNYNTRITFGILVSLSTMLFVAICNIGWDGFSSPVSYRLNLVAIGVVAFGCTMQQSSYYGFTGSLPPRYTQAVMTGESIAGIWVATDRIITKYCFEVPKNSTLIFFLSSIMMLVGHCLLHHLMMKHPLVLYYLKLTEESRQKRRIQLHLNPNEDATLMENDGADTGYGVLKLQSPNGQDMRGLSFANPVYSPTATSACASVTLHSVTSSADMTSSNMARDAGGSEITTPATVSPRTSYKVDDVVIETARPFSWAAFKYGLATRWMVAQAIYPYMVCIGLVYFTTLSLYPGIASEIPSCHLGSWMPIVLMTSFNFFDLMGKISAAWSGAWRGSQLVTAAGVRLLAVPLLLLCAAPRPHPTIHADIYPILFSIVLGFSNGVFGSVPMIMAPSRVSREHREIAGNMMTLSYNGGLLSGALVSYLLLGILGPPGSGSPCRSYPTPPLPTLTTTTTIAAVVANITTATATTITTTVLTTVGL